jgi:glycosyltransferase involved in cell wall biosynthesis
VRITFAMPFLNVTGGTRVLLDYADALHALGHQVTVVHPLWPYRFHYGRLRQMRVFARHVMQGNRVDWYPLKAPLVQVPRISNQYLPDADIVIATAWPTAHDVAKLSPEKGKKVYFIQLYETGTGPSELVDATYRLPMFRMTCSRILREQIESLFDVKVNTVLYPGINTKTFFPDGQPEADTVLMPYHPDIRKGGAVGMEALKLLKTKMPSLKVKLFGHRIPPDFVPEWMQFFKRPDGEKLRHLYSTSAALLYPSRVEACPLPPLEAMACGCAVVSTPVGEVPVYCTDGEHGLLPEIGNPESMANCLERVLKDAILRTKLVAGGSQQVQMFVLERGTRHLVETLENLLSLT